MVGLPSVGQTANSLLGQTAVLNPTTHKTPPISGAQLEAIKKIIYPLDNLLELQWDGVGIPCANLHTTISHDVVEHKYPYVDGAKLEEMGRNPMVITGTIPFFNSISPAKSESWTKGQLYPLTISKFLISCSDGKTHTLQHPFLGEIQAKCISVTTNLVATARGGEAVDITWKETIVNNTTQLLSNLGVSAAGFGKQATQLDNSITSLLTPNPRSLFPQYFNQKVNFGSMALEVLSLLTQTQFFSEQAISILNQIEFFALNIIESCQNFNNIALAAISSNAYNLWSTAILIKQDPSITPKPLKIKVAYRTKGFMTLSQLANQFSNSINDIMSLNPSLISKPIIPPDTKVFYFAQSAAQSNLPATLIF